MLPVATPYAGAPVRRTDADSAKPTLIDAARKGDEAALRTLLRDPLIDLNATDAADSARPGCTALMFAVERGDDGIARLLVSAGAAVSQADAAGMTPLMLAAHLDHAPMLTLLLEAGAQVNAVDAHGLSALMWAAMQGAAPCARLLVMAGARTDLRDAEGNAASDLADKFGQGDIAEGMAQWEVERLAIWSEALPGIIQSGDPAAWHAWIGKLRCSGSTPQHWLDKALRLPGKDVEAAGTPLSLAARLGHDALLDGLVAAGAELDGRDASGCTALMHAARGGHVRCVQTLLRHGARSGRVDDDGWSPLAHAAALGHADTVRHLLQAGVAPDQPSATGSTALMLAAMGGHAGVVQELLQCAATVDARGHNGGTALMAAARNGKAEVCRLLLAAGADATLADGEGHTAHALALREGHAALATLLQPRPSSPPGGGRRAASAGPACGGLLRDEGTRPVPAQLDGAAAVQMLDAVASPAPEKPGPGAAHIVALVRSDDLHGWRAWLDAAEAAARNVRAELNVIVRVRLPGEEVEEACTPLMVAAHLGLAHWMEALLDAGARLDMRGGLRRTALMYAARAGQTECVVKLLEQGADVDATDSIGWSPLMYAAVLGHEGAAALLLRAGASVDRVSRMQSTALMLAATNDRVGMVRLLLHAGAQADRRGSNEWTALMGAAHNGHGAVCSLLLQAGADLSITGGDGKTAEMLARERGHRDVAAMLSGGTRREPEQGIAGKGGGRADAKVQETQGVLATRAAHPDSATAPLSPRTVPQTSLADRRTATAAPDAVDVPTTTAARIGTVNTTAPTVPGAVPQASPVVPMPAPVTLLEAIEAQDMAAFNAVLTKLRDSCRDWTSEIDRCGKLGKALHGVQDNMLTCLMAAAYLGFDEAVEALLEAGATPDVTTAYGWTALMFAARYGPERIVRRLIDAGAELDRLDSKGRTALMLAAIRDHEGITTLLMAKGARVTRQSFAGMTAVTFALQEGSGNAMRAFVDAGVNLRKAFPDKWQMLAIDAARAGHASLIEPLAHAGVDMEYYDDEGKTALMHAAMHGYTEVVQALVRAGAQLERSSVKRTGDKYKPEGMTALMYALRAGHRETTQALIDAAATLNAMSDDSKSSLLFEWEKNSPSLFEMLPASAVGTEDKDDYKQMPLVMAARKFEPHIVQMLLRSSAHPPLHQMLSFGQSVGAYALTEAIWTYIDGQNKRSEEPLTKTVSMLIAAGVALNERHPRSGMGCTSLILAAMSDCKPVVDLLINAHANLDLGTTSRVGGGETALMIAASKGSFAIVASLCEAGANLNITNAYGDTALMLAVRARQSHIVNHLCMKGANIQVANADGETALMCAAKIGSVGLVRRLLGHGARVDVYDKAGHSVLDIAAMAKHKDVEEVLRAANAKRSWYYWFS